MPGDFGDNTSPDGRYGYQDPNADPTRITDPNAWAAYNSKRHRDALLGILGTLGLTTGLGAAFGGAGAGAASSLGPIGTVGTGEGMAGGGMAGAAGVGAGAAGAGAAGAAGGAAGTVGTAAGKAAGGLMGGMSGSDWAALMAALTGVVGGAVTNKNQTDYTPTTATTDPNLKALIDRQMKRMDQSDPLYESIIRMAGGLLPTQYQPGSGAPTSSTMPIARGTTSPFGG